MFQRFSTRLHRTYQRLNNATDQEGQITVFVAILFFILVGVALLIFGGMREYMKMSLVEEAFEQAGEDILAEYDRPLFERYHIFLLDPREVSYITEDAMGRIQDSFGTSGFFDGIQGSIRLDSKKNVTEEDGKNLLKQIKEWETCQSIYKLPDLMNQLLKSTERKKAIDEALSGCKDESEGSGPTSGHPADEEDLIEETEEEREIKKTWKEWKQVLGNILDAGVLGYAVDDAGSISNLQLQNTSSLPSKKAGEGTSIFQMDGMSLTNLSKLKKICEEGFQDEKDQALLTSDAYLIPYIFECFTHYRQADKKKKHCLKYEAEYLIAGKTKDKDNLKYVANQLFLMRFLVNYSHAVKDPAIRTKADSMAIVLTGLLGFPEGKEVVTQLLTASLCYGESLLEVRALFHGEKVALVKSEANWNLTFTNAAAKLTNRSQIIKVSGGIDYEQYLTMLFIMKSGSRRLLYRMMDLMQCNVALEEPGFLMKECLTSFRWTGSFSWAPWIKNIIGYGLRFQNSFSIERTGNVAYQ